MKAIYSADQQELGNAPSVAISAEETVNLPINQLLERLNTSQRGLSPEEAANRIETFGHNEFSQRKKKTALLELIQHLGNPLIIILLIAGVVSGLLGETINAAIILSIILISIGLDLFQEAKAEKAAELLKAKVATTATVLRDGAKRK